MGDEPLHMQPSPRRSEKPKKNMVIPDAFDLERDEDLPKPEEDTLAPLRTQPLQGGLDSSRSASSAASSQNEQVRSLRRTTDKPQISLWEHWHAPGPPKKPTLRTVRDGQRGVSGKAAH